MRYRCVGAAKVLLLCFLGLGGLWEPSRVRGEEFSYRHEAGDLYRILSTVREDVYVDRVLSHRAEILNRIAVEVRSVSEGKGRHRAVFQTSERSAGAGRQSFQWSREYESEFDRDRFGYVTIDAKYYMPVVRNVPVFPDRDLGVGERWSAEGHEMHDFRDSFGIVDPYRIPFTAEYVFLGEREWQGKRYPAFSVSYRIFSEPGVVRGRVWPSRIQGASDQIVYWDRELGQARAYTEHFRMIFSLSDGRTVEYRGSAGAEILESVRMDKEKIAGDIAGDIGRLGIDGATVRVVDEGIAISLQDIRFQPDQAALLPAEREKLDKIAGILRQYGDRDILVAGHTALAGTEEGRRNLSLERAAAVAEYLIAKGVRGADRVVVRGFGAEQPVADNRTEEGMRQNRRVEITILEN
ncbi:MAG: OmpA family protein [Treponema sp.]|jgi:outer membrane protein OmpA-like peptidoglycan-associated protein|nr:OmpA family protein [Treponema sp.]